MRRTLVRRRSKSARVAQAAGFFSLLLALMGLAAFRFGQIEPLAFLIVLGLAFAIAIIALLFGAAGLWKLWNEGARAGGASLRGMLLAALTLAPAAYAGIQSLRLPPIFDVTTDLSNPPRFPIGARGPVVAQAGPPVSGPQAALLQAQAYPDLAPRLVEAAPSAALAAVDRAAELLGWTPSVNGGGLDLPSGMLRGFTDTTAIFGFTDDIVVRILPVGDQVLVDMRSASRAGSNDLGTNAARIRAFMAELDAQLAAAAR